MNDLDLNDNLLVNGKIPPHTECPYRIYCASFRNGNCYHQGARHRVAYSCASARGWAIVRRGTP